MRRLFCIVMGLLGCGHRAAEPAQHAHHGHGDGHMHRHFDNADQWAKVFDDPARDAWQEPDKVIAALELQPAMTVVDVGAGTGYFTVRLARVAKQVIATDVEPDMVRHLTARAGREGLANVVARVTPPDDPQLAASSVERILVVDVWHHLGDRAAYAGKLAAGLATGGALAIVDFKLDAAHGPPREHRLAPDTILAELRAAGLDASLSAVALRDQYIVIGRKR